MLNLDNIFRMLENIKSGDLIKYEKENVKLLCTFIEKEKYSIKVFILKSSHPKSFPKQFATFLNVNWKKINL